MSNVLAYGSSPIKRVRRTVSEMQAVREAIYDVLQIDRPMSDRQVFYQLVNRTAVEKTEPAYKRSVVRLLTIMRRSGEIPFEWIADSTRWMRKPRTFDSMQHMLDLT